MSIVFRPATVQDAIDLAPRLKPSDIDELLLSSGSIEATLIDSVRNSTEAIAATRHGEVLMLAGVAPWPGEEAIGVPWMLCSLEALRHRRRFIEDALPVVEQWHKRYPFLTNFVHVENVTSIAWLKRLGFTMGPIIPEYGVGKAPFQQFYRGVPQPCASQ